SRSNDTTGHWQCHLCEIAAEAWFIPTFPPLHRPTTEARGDPMRSKTVHRRSPRGAGLGRVPRPVGAGADSFHEFGGMNVAPDRACRRLGVSDIPPHGTKGASGNI